MYFAVPAEITVPAIDVRVHGYSISYLQVRNLIPHSDHFTREFMP
jgi:hypothetical protein